MDDSCARPDHAATGDALTAERRLPRGRFWANTERANIDRRQFVCVSHQMNHR